MELTPLDIIYFTFIGLVLIGGIIAIIILCPKENKLKEEKAGCYRYIVRDGRLIRSGKASIFENWGRKPVYIEKGPFEINAYIDSGKGADGVSYNAVALAILYLPETSAQESAEYLYSIMEDIQQETVCKLLEEEFTAVLEELLRNYKGENPDTLKESFRENIISRLQRYGYDLYCPPTLKITAVNNS